MIKNFIVFDVDQAKMASHTDKSALLQGQHRVVSRISVADSGNFGSDFGRMDGDPMKEYALLHVYERCKFGKNEGTLIVDF